MYSNITMANQRWVDYVTRTFAPPIHTHLKSFRDLRTYPDSYKSEHDGWHYHIDEKEHIVDNIEDKESFASNIVGHGTKEANQENGIPPANIMLMIMLACLVALGLCLAIFALISWRRKRFHERRLIHQSSEERHNQDLHAPSNNRGNRLSNNTQIEVLRSSRFSSLGSETTFRCEQYRDIMNIGLNGDSPPSYDLISKLDDKDLPSYDEVIQGVNDGTTNS